MEGYDGEYSKWNMEIETRGFLLTVCPFMDCPLFLDFDGKLGPLCPRT